MYANIPKDGVNEASYAARCLQGDTAAGLALVRLLWAKGKDATMLELLDVAFPKGTPTQEGFDLLADARAEAMRHRDFHRVMREGGIPDREPMDIGDLATGD